MPKRKRRKKSGPVVLILLLVIAFTVFFGYKLSRANLISLVTGRIISMLPVKIKISFSGSTPLGGMYFEGIKVLDDDRKVIAEIKRIQVNNSLNSLIKLYLDKEGTVNITADGVRVDADRSQIENIIKKLGLEEKTNDKEESTPESEMTLYFDVKVSDLNASLADETRTAQLIGGSAIITTRGLFSADYSVDKLVFTDESIKASAELLDGTLYSSGGDVEVKAFVKKAGGSFGLSEFSFNNLILSGSLSDLMYGAIKFDSLSFHYGEMVAQADKFVIEAGFDGKNASADIDSEKVIFNSGDLRVISSGFSGNLRYSENSNAGIVLKKLELALSEDTGYEFGDCNITAEMNSDGDILFGLLFDMGLDIKGSYQNSEIRLGLSTGKLKYKDFESLVPLFGSTVFGSDNTTISLNAGLFSDLSKKDGKAEFDLLTDNININGNLLDAKASACLSYSGSKATIDRFKIDSSGFCADITGKADLAGKMFDGNMVVRKEDSEESYADISLSKDISGTYSLAAVSDHLPDFSLEGEYLPTEDENISILNAIWKYSTGSYPIEWTIEKSDNGFSAYSNGLFMDISLDNEPSAYLTLRGFYLPDFGGIVGGKLSGLLNFGVSEDGGIDVTARKLTWDDEGYGFTISGNFNSLSGVNVTDFKFANSELKPMMGTAIVALSEPGKWNIHNLSGKVILNSETGEHIYISMVPDSGMVDFMVDIEKFNSTRLRYPKIPVEMIDINAYGSTDFKEKLILSFDCNIGFNGNEYGTTGQYYDNKLELNDLRINKFFTDTFLVADIMNGTLEFSTTASVESKHVDRSARISSGLSVKAAIDRKYQGFNISEVIRTIPDTVIRGTLSIENLNADNRFLVDNLPVSITIDRFRYIKLSGDEINATLDLTDGLSFVADIKGDKLPFAFEGKGYFKDGYTDVKADYIRVPFQALNIILLRPILNFGNCDIYGSGRMVGPIVNPEFFGNIGCPDLSLSVFWVPDQEISVKNLYVTVYGDTASIASTPFWVINKKTRESTQGFVYGECSITQMSIPDWFLDITLPSNTVDVYVPIPGAKLTIYAKASGNLRLTGIGPVVVITGNAKAEDAQISMPCIIPDWFLIPVMLPDNDPNRFRGRTQDFLGIDLDITTGTGVKFLYPNATSPAIRVTASEGQHAHVNYDYSTKKAKIDGVATVSGGNIYYFQKDFFITEGSISFDSNSTSVKQLKDFSPVINLRATLKTYDKNGNPTEIYLILTDSYLNDYNPRFDSSTGLSTEEIFAILGNSILPTDVYGAGSTITLASVATTTYEMLNRLGIMKDFLNFMPFNDLSDTLKGALNLDMLSFRSLLLQNFIIDTLNMDNREKYSPIARYLNGTSMFLGKYFSNQFLLQGTVRLDSIDENHNMRKTDVPTFLANDLGVDMELSFGWKNPIAEFTLFTQPTELSVFGFMDNIGLSIKKRLSL